MRERPSKHHPKTYIIPHTKQKQKQKLNRLPLPTPRSVSENNEQSNEEQYKREVKVNDVNPNLSMTSERQVRSSRSGEFRTFKTYFVLGSKFDVDSRYEVLDVIGRGAYGVVVAAMDHVTNRHVAIKKISDIFDHATFAKRTLREVRLLRLLRHENLIGIRSVMKPLDHSFTDLYIVSELMETDMSSVIKSMQPLSNDHLQFFVYQILRGVKYLHTSNVLHRDLKPRNLLVNSNCDVKICDFGLARIAYPDMQWKCSSMTDYVATRWYRAPEIIVGWGDYTKMVDVWSIGCILAELIVRKPIFAGSCNEEQIQKICELVEPPDVETAEQIEKLKWCDMLREEAYKSQRESINYRERLEEYFEPYRPDPLAVDVIYKMLR